MPARERRLVLGSRIGDRAVAEFARAARERRQALGLTLRGVAIQLGISRTTLARWEAGVAPGPDFRQAGRLLRLLGMELSVRVYPADEGLRDVAHARLLSRLHRMIGDAAPRRLEVPMPIPGDLRAWDMVLTLGQVQVGIAAETRLRDWQALIRAERLKVRDSGVDRLILVLADTRANRAAVRAAAMALTTELPLDGRTLLAGIRAGRDPGGDGLLFV